MVAAFTAVAATALSWLISSRVLGWTTSQFMWAVVASNIGAWCCLPTTLVLERVRWFKRLVIPGWARTWLFFVAVYFGVLLGLVPEMRDLRAFKWMSLPLIYTSGFTIIVYGPVHDFFVRRSQRRGRAKAKAAMAASAHSGSSVREAGKLA